MQIDSLIHMGRGIFGIDWGSTAFIISNFKSQEDGVYFRLHKRNFQHIYYYHIEQLFLKSLNDHSFKYDFDKYRDDDGVSFDLSSSDSNGFQLCYPHVNQHDFEKIPGCPIGYWVSKRIVDAFSKHELPVICETRCGLATGNNDYYIRKWQEVNYDDISFGNSREGAKQSNKKWFPYNSAGGYRKWYGLQIDVINWFNDGNEMQTKLDPTGKRIWAHNFNLDKIFLPHIGWSDISSVGNSFRYYEQGYLFTSNAAFPKEASDSCMIMSYANSKMVQSLVSLLNPTIHFTPGNFLDLPFSLVDFRGRKANLTSITNNCIAISKKDWDAHEISWNFETSPLLEVVGGEIEEEGEIVELGPAPDLLEYQVKQYKAIWEQNFNQLHANEEELNRQFIEIYGLEDELTPDVPLDEITILQQGEISIENNQIVWHPDVIMKQFISYAIGCMMGRYRLDKKGLCIAHPNPSAEEIAPYYYNEGTFEIDDDGIIPLMAKDSRFDDNCVNRFTDFVKLVFGEETLTDNMNYLEEALGKSVEQYLVKDFWKDHKKMYQNRPIYWLFSSKKGAFQVIAYMHRMNKYTVENIRNKYLLPHIEYLRQELASLDARVSALTAQERKLYQKLQKDLDECMEYHDRLHSVADKQIDFDLDDGVVVNYAKFGDVLAKLK